MHALSRLVPIFLLCAIGTTALAIPRTIPPADCPRVKEYRVRYMNQPFEADMTTFTRKYEATAIKANLDALGQTLTSASAPAGPTQEEEAKIVAAANAFQQNLDRVARAAHSPNSTSSSYSEITRCSQDWTQPGQSGIDKLKACLKEAAHAEVKRWLTPKYDETLAAMAAFMAELGRFQDASADRAEVVRALIPHHGILKTRIAAVEQEIADLRAVQAKSIRQLQEIDKAALKACP